jgi:hypothetical protein
MNTVDFSASDHTLQPHASHSPCSAAWTQPRKDNIAAVHYSSTHPTLHHTSRAMSAMTQVQRACEGSALQQMADKPGALDSRRIQQLAPVITVSTASTAMLVLSD